MVELQLQCTLFTTQQHDNTCGTDHIGYGCGDGHALNAKAEADDQHEIKHGVNNTSHHQDVKRTAGVAHTAQDGGSKIEYKKERNAHKVKTQVEHGHVEHIGRGVHQFEYGPRHAYANKHQQHATDDADQWHGADGASHTLVVALTKVIGEHDIGTHRYANKKVD